MMITARFRTLAFLIAAGVTLGGCETMTSVKEALNSINPFGSGAEEVSVAAIAPASGDGSCPDVRIVQDLNQVHQFADAGNPGPDSSVSSVQMINVQDQCNMVKGSMAVDMTLAFHGELGPKARVNPTDKPSFAYPYFVAITNGQGSIIAKEVFAVTMDYDATTNTQTHTEQLRQMIPMDGLDPKTAKVLIGFQLNDQELAFNRTLPPEPAPLANPVNLIEPAAGGTTTTITPDQQQIPTPPPAE